MPGSIVRTLPAGFSCARANQGLGTFTRATIALLGMWITKCSLYPPSIVANSLTEMGSEIPRDERGVDNPDVIGWIELVSRLWRVSFPGPRTATLPTKSGLTEGQQENSNRILDQPTRICKGKSRPALDSHDLKGADGG